MTRNATQGLVRAALHDLAALQHDDLVAVANGAEPVGDDQAGAAAAAQVVVDRLFGRRIERAGGFVEDENRGIVDERARDLEALPLTAAEVAAALFHVPGIAARACGDVVVDRGVARRANEIRLGNRSSPTA